MITVKIEKWSDVLIIAFLIIRGALRLYLNLSVCLTATVQLYK